MKLNRLNRREIMKAAHAMAKHMEGDYSARLSLALKLVWSRAKEAAKVLAEGIRIELSKCKEWKKGTAHRYYLEGVLIEPKSLDLMLTKRMVISFAGYYDMVTKKLVVKSEVRSKQLMTEELVSEYMTEYLAAKAA